MEENDFSFRDFLGVVGGLAGTIGVYLLTGGNGWVMLAAAAGILVWIMCKILAHEFRKIKKIVMEVMEEEDDPMRISEKIVERLQKSQEDEEFDPIEREIDIHNADLLFKIVNNLDKTDEELYDDLLIDTNKKVDYLIKKYGLEGKLEDPDNIINPTVIVEMIREVRDFVSKSDFATVYKIIKNRRNEIKKD